MIYDIKTKNDTFIEMWQELKNKGVKNNKFFLLLYDESLQGVDPHDEKNLTEEQKYRIQIEVQKNVWYFLREIIRIPEPGGFIQYGLHLGNLAQNYCMINDINVIELLPRQHGKTIGAVCFYVWVYNFATENSHIIFGNKQVPDSKANLKRFKDITNALPSYLLSHRDPKLDKDNVEEIRNNVNNNMISLLKSANDENSADKAGRGLTVPIFWIDEFSFLKYNGVIYTAASPAQSKAAERAKANKVPYGKLLTTTPSNLDDPAGLYLYKMLNQAIKFNEDWYDKDIADVKKIISDGSKNDFVHIEYSYQQLGKSEAWFKQQCKALGWDLFKIKREVKLEWMYASNDSPFTEEQLDAISKVVRDPVAKITIFNKHVLEVLRPLSNIYNKSWLVSIDIAAGLSQDSSAITVIDPLTYEPVIIYNNNSIDIPDLALLVEELVSIYLPNAVIIPENNSIGITLINLLLRSKVAANLYYEVQEKEAQITVEQSRLNSAKKVKKEVRVFGNRTDAANRKIMTEEILFDVVNNHPELIISKQLFSEIKTLVRETSGKINHKRGCHDDQLMSYLQGLYVLFYCKNINRFVKTVSNDVLGGNTRNTAAINNINEIRKIDNKAKYDKFKTTKELLDRYDRIQKTEGIDRNSADYGQPVEVLSSPTESISLSNDKFNQQNQRKKVSKSTLNMLNSFNKRR